MPEFIGTIVTVAIFLIVLIILASCIKIVPQANAVIVERLGGYRDTWNVGLHFKAPIIDRVAKRVLLKEQVVDFAPQPVITKDNVTMRIDTVVFYQITDPKLYAYGVENPIMAIENLTATTLRNIIGDMELDETLTSREVINTKMRASLDIATDPWGIKVNRVELKNIIPPSAIQDAMEKQMKAERERREAILIAEGEKKSTILVAEGKKESAILEAEAEKEAAILRAEAQKEATIREAEGEAEAILAVQKANADGIRFLNEAAPSSAIVQLKSLEAFAKAADGKATKIIIPSEIQGLAGLAKSLVEVGVEENENSDIGGPDRKQEALVGIIKSISEEIEVTAIASEDEAMAALASDEEYALFLLDINLDSTQLSDTSGMNVAKEIRKVHCYEFTPIVFVTSILSLELQSYRELQCYRYITKPFDEKEVEEIIKKVMTHSEERQEECSIKIKKDGINYKIWCDDILFVQAVPRGLRLVMKEESLDIRYLTLKQLLPKLPKEKFIQCHRMYIVNRKYIDYVDQVNRLIKIQGSDEPVEIGVTYKTQIRSLLNE